MRLYQKDTYAILAELEKFSNEINSSSDNELKLVIYRIKSFISANPVLLKKYKEKTGEYEKYVATKKYNDTCHSLAEIIKDASFKIYQDDLYCKWYPASMYKQRLNKQEFLNITCNYNNDRAIIFQGLYDFYNLLLINEPSKNSPSFVKNGNTQFMELALTTMLDKVQFMDDKNKLLIKKLTEIINTAIDFHNVDVAEIFMLDGLPWHIVVFWIRISLIKVLKELKEYILIKTEAENKNYKDIREKKMLFLQYSQENNSFTLGGQPFELKPFLVKYLKTVIEHSRELRQKGTGNIKHKDAQKWSSYKTLINKKAEEQFGFYLINKDYKINATIRWS